MNPFVNLHKRGIELPHGCKDLIDVLKPTTQSEQFAEFLSRAADAHCHYCGAQSCGGPDILSVALNAPDQAKWMCGDCTTELCRFLDRELGSTFNEFPKTDQVDRLRRLTPRAHAHMKRWAS
jgi:hypothetical protein